MMVTIDSHAKATTQQFNIRLNYNVYVIMYKTPYYLSFLFVMLFLVFRASCPKLIIKLPVF